MPRTSLGWEVQRSPKASLHNEKFDMCMQQELEFGFEGLGFGVWGLGEGIGIECFALLFVSGPPPLPKDSFNFHFSRLANAAGLLSYPRIFTTYLPWQSTTVLRTWKPFFIEVQQKITTPSRVTVISLAGKADD